MRTTTPLDYDEIFDLWVKREDLSCPPPGPPFSKMRGVMEHIKKRPERVIGVLDTVHSQAGHAVAYACSVLGRTCVNYYPVYKSEGHAPALRPPQIAASALGAATISLPAGRSAILYHAAKARLVQANPNVPAYMMPNALKLPESVIETANELGRTGIPPGVEHVLVPSSSATIAAGVLRGLAAVEWQGNLIVHLGYSRSKHAVLEHLERFPDYLPVASTGITIEIVDEGYEYANRARAGDTPGWPCNDFYDLKAFRWYRTQPRLFGKTLLWNIG